MSLAADPTKEEQVRRARQLIAQYEQAPSLVTANSIGLALFGGGVYDKALEWFMRAAEHLQHEALDPSAIPSVVNVYLNLGNAAVHAEKFDMARVAFDQVRKLDPDNARAQHGLDLVANDRLLKSMLALEEETDNLVSSHRRPLRAVFHRAEPDFHPTERIALVMQGPLLDYRDFTLESVRLHRRLFPYADLIVSTWDDSPAALVDALRAEGATVLLNALPAQAGFRNVNLQLRSTMAGLRAAAARGATHILKSRTDYRIYSPSFFTDALTFLESFPLPASLAGTQQARLVSFSDLNRYAIYNVYDRNMFGLAADMLAYWDAPEDTAPAPAEEDYRSMLGIARSKVAETYMLQHFMARLGRPLDWTLDDHWAILRDHFVVMDQDTADFYWCKYERHWHFPRWPQYPESLNIQPFRFADWLRLQSGRRPFNGDQRIIERKHGAAIGDLLAEGRMPQQG